MHHLTTTRGYQNLITTPDQTPVARMPEVDPTMGEPEKPPSRLEQIKYYTSLFLGALAIVCVFGFLFLVSQQQ